MIPKDPRPWILQRLRERRRTASAAAAACGAAVTLAGISAVLLSGSSHGDAALAPVPEARYEAPVVRGDASALGGLGLGFGFSSGDGRVLEDVLRFTEAAGAPTSTPVPPEPTATLAPPPTPTPRPRPPGQQQPLVAPPAQPTPVPPAPTAIPPAPPPPAVAIVGLNTAPMSGYEQELFDATNQRRIANGLAPLRVNGYLIGIARIRSTDMAANNYFSHTSPVTGDTAFSLMDAYGVPYGWAGENLAKNNYPDSEAVGVADTALWNSPSHRANMLNPHYTDMGVALVIDATGMKYFTIVFTGP